MNIDTLKDILAQAEQAAADAAQAQFNKQGSDWDACGFGWVNIYRFNDKKLDGRTKMGKLMRAAGVRQDYTRAFSVWNPGGYGGQSISIKEAAATAYAQVLQAAGFTAYAGSRMD